MAAEQEAGVFRRADAAITNTLTGFYDAVFRDGTLAAFLRQGVKELGEAFGTMMPESIQVSEPGGVWNPLYADIAAADRRESPAVLASPGDIAREAKSSATVHGGMQRDSQPLPSPSDIAREQQPAARPEQGHGHAQEQGREM